MRAGQYKYSYVELGLDALPVRIFRNQKTSLAQGWRQIWIHADAVKAIRHKLWLRSNGKCELCGAPITEQSAHMHESRHRGQGGEISLVNSVMICASCHQYQHRDRETRWGENKESA